MSIFFFFFFSSRRRHTRWNCDWSSDVCSSDLPFTSIAGMKEIVAPMYDQGYSALIDDLAQRGLLATTLVANLAEFGRTPKINPAGGRDHWPNCWTVYLAGGGVKGGRLVGKSDDN